MLANTLNITKDEVNFENFEIEYLLDKEMKYTIDNLKDAPFKKGINKKSEGISYLNNFWLKIDLQNSTQNSKELYFTYNYILFVKYLNIYIVQDNKVIKKNIFSMFNKEDHKKLSGNSLLTKFNLKTNEKVTLYVQTKTTSPLLYNLAISDIKHHTQNHIQNYAYTALLLSLLLGLAIYYLFLYALTPYKEYIYFSLFLFSVSIWSAYVYGVITQFLQLYGKDAFYFNATLYLIPFFTLLFFKTLFLKNNDFKKIKVLVNILASVLLFIAVFYIFSLMGFSTWGIIIIRYAEYINMGIISSFMAIAIYVYVKKVAWSGYFLLGYIIHVSFFYITISLFMGKVPINNFTIHANLIGTFIESIFFSLLLFNKIKTLHQISKDNEEMLHLQKNKISAMNEVIENIAHQWRQPLSQINSAVLIVDDELHESEQHNHTIENKLTEIESLTKYMSQTIDDFKNFYQKSQTKTIFSLDECLRGALSIIEATLKFNAIEVKMTIKGKISLNTFLSELQQVILIILNNSKDALVLHEVKHKKIEILAVKKHNKIVIKISNNAGIIDERIINKIFEPYFTTKHQSQNTGLGLYISKSIIEHTMKGSIYAKNIDNNACFFIELIDTLKANDE